MIWIDNRYLKSRSLWVGVQWGCVEVDEVVEKAYKYDRFRLKQGLHALLGQFRVIQIFLFLSK